MFCIPITGPTLIEASIQVSKSLRIANILEFRLDLFEEYDLGQLSDLRKKIKLPVIFTLRKKGKWTDEIKELARLAPTYFDLEYDISPDFVKELRAQFPEIKLILSYHNFAHTPDDLDAILKKMKATPAHLYKMACTANSTNDSLRMLRFIRKNSPLIGLCMGEKGHVSRILGPLFGSPWTYAYLTPDQKTAEGQLSADELNSIYSPTHFTSSTALYGLIGGSVPKSMSHFIHNRVMHDLSLDALYVKMAVEPQELSDFFTLAKEIGFRGLSVTMPLKEQVITFLDHIDAHAKKIGAVNTLLFEEGKIFGTNTDGKGALDAIEAKFKVLDKRIVILGAGGAARAIIYEAIHRGAKVTVLNRTPEKARQLANEFKIEGGGLDRIDDSDYDILINTTPNPLPIPPDSIRQNSLVMDIWPIPEMTSLLNEAAARKCTLVFGYEMLINQAIAQEEFWFSTQFDKSYAKRIMQEEALKHL